MVKLNGLCSAILQNELPPKEKDPGSFILPCAIGTTTVSNALVDPAFDDPRDLEEFLLSDDDLGIFPNDNDLLPNLENHDTMFLSPPGSARLNDNSSEMFGNPNSNSSISVDDFVDMDDVWDNLDFRDLIDEATKFPPQSPFNIMSRNAYNSIMKHELVYKGNNMVGFARNLHVIIEGHQFLIDFIILENINEFVEKGLPEVLFGQPFKEHVGIADDRVNEVPWFKIEDDKKIFNMPRAKKRFGESIILTKKIKGFYQGCLELGEEYKNDQELIDWIKGHGM
ncbi:hypothetical protein Tco_1394391 [Tanacetum coccineum]